MSTISEHVLELYNQLVGDEIQPIDDEVVNEAIDVVNKVSVSDTNSLFYVLAAINLLNAAIKTTKYKSQLFYGFIKTRISTVVDTVLSDMANYNDTRLYYDKVQQCMYFEVYGVIFSFHRALESKKITDFATANEPIIWTGIRLQRIAQNIFFYAKEHCKDSYIQLQSTINTKTMVTPNTNTSSNLVLCPECGCEISSSALFCPNCGFIPSYNIITNGCSVGDKIQICVNINKISGEIIDISPVLVKIKTFVNNVITVRQSSIDSIQITAGSTSIKENNLLNTNQVSQSLSSRQLGNIFDTLVLQLFPILSINDRTIIPTNATITEINDNGIVITYDSGNVETLKGNFLNFKKGSCIPGSRLYCNKISESAITFSLMETSYYNILNIFRKALLYRKGLTDKRRRIILAILKFMMDEMTSKKEAYIKIEGFQKNIFSYLGIRPDLLDDESEEDDIPKDIPESNHDDSAKVELFKTDTENSGLPQLKVLGKIDLNTTPDSKRQRISRGDQTTNVDNCLPQIVNEKPFILTSPKTNEFLEKKLPNLPMDKCKHFEKELDTLVRKGEKEECLRRSYQIINTSRPIAKYLRSYLDRIVNTEIALNHTSDALQSLAYLIVLTEQQKDANVNSIGHLYITMARLYLKDKNKEEALKAILYAESLKPNNNEIVKLKESIQKIDSIEIEHTDHSCETEVLNNVSNDVSNNISKMLLEDVCQEARRQELLPSNEIVPVEQMFGIAQNKRNDDTESFEDKAQLFLEAAGAYYNSKQTATIMYKISVANYARLKGHGMYARFANLIRNNSAELVELQALRDSACSYYIEALEIFNILGEKDNLRELLLRYLQLSFVTSQIEGSKTPDSDWESIPLGVLQDICLKGDSLENLNLLLRTYLVVGSAAEDVWISLINDKGGIGPFRGRCSDSDKFKKQAFKTLNQINQSTIDVNYDLEDFMHNLFIYRNERKNFLNDAIQSCLSWKFYSFDISTFDNKWKKVLEYKNLMTNTDITAVNSLIEVIDILKPYAGRKENERTRILVRAQQILLGAQKKIADTTTYYGNTFFSSLINNWLKDISHQLEERDASTLPMLSISSAPAFITKDDKGRGVVSIVVTNNGDSTAESFFVTAKINGKEYTITHEDELSSGDCCGENFVSNDFSSLESANVIFTLVAKYQGKKLKPIECQATYEVESEDVLSDEIQIPWNITKTPDEHIFKGREEKLKTLVNHYLSKDRSTTYIIYGITRTGKSSILDYLCDRINGKKLREDPTKQIMTFKWDFSKTPYSNSTVSSLWTNLLVINIYDKLTDELANIIDKAYPSGIIPSENELSQADLDVFVNILYDNNIVPLIIIDEFSYVKRMLKAGLVDSTFIKCFRELSLSGKACFVYAGTYDIKDLPKDKDYGITGEMNNTTIMHINEIEDQYANELIDACPQIIFDDIAKNYIRALSGCIPYWIQWICLACGKYAVANRHRHLGFNEVNYVVKVLTGESQPGKKDTWESLDETNFHNNQIDPENIAEYQLISSISYLTRESTQIERGISMDELKRLWDKYSVKEDKRLNMTRALASLKEKKILYSFTDEGREVYRLSVDLFRRWWFVHNRDLDLEFSL